MSKIVDEEGNVVSAVIRVGKNGDYVNLDALVMDATDNLIDEIYQEDSELVAIVGRKLLADKYFPIVNKDQPNSEALAADIIISQTHRQPARRPCAVLPGERDYGDASR